MICQHVNVKRMVRPPSLALSDWRCLACGTEFIEAEAASPAALDVERLRQAMVAYYNHRLNMGMPGPNRRIEAEAIAAEYARLSPSEGSGE